MSIVEQVTPYLSVSLLQSCLNGTYTISACVASALPVAEVSEPSLTLNHSYLRGALALFLQRSSTALQYSIAKCKPMARDLHTDPPCTLHAQVLTAVASYIDHST